jgi:hypothetical protein
MADYTIEVSVPNVGPAGPEATVPPPAYASAGAAVDAGKPFGGLYRNTDGTVGWIEEVDPDVQAYLDLTGATARWALQSFVVGVKALGLWDNMVCWPMRLAQNKNAGETVYSLGGLGTYNGTLVGGAARESNGINLAADGRRITTNLGPLSQPFSIFTVHTLDTTGSQLFIYQFRPQPGPGAWLALFASGDATNLTIFAGGDSPFASGGSFANNTMFAYQADFNAASSTRSINGASPTSIVLGDAVAARLTMGPVNPGKGPVLFSFCAVVEQAAVPSLYTLYKTTLGTSLGLP